MSVILDNLYLEHASLKEKLLKLEELIVAYGGSIPGAPSAVVPNTPATYPSWGTWKEKIIFVLTGAPRPVTVSELLELIRAQESIADEKKLHTTLTQYCSNMGLAGELQVLKGYRNRYALPVASQS